MRVNVQGGDLPEELRNSIVETSKLEEGQIKGAIGDLKLAAAEKIVDNITSKDYKSEYETKNLNQQTSTVDVQKAFGENVHKGLEMSEVEYSELATKLMEAEQVGEGGMKMEPFNMKYEREANIIDKDGNYNYESSRYKEVQDPWLDSLEGEEAIWRPRAQKDATLGKRELVTEDQDKPMDTKDVLADIVTIVSHMKQGEVCKNAIDRLLGRETKQNGQPAQRKNFKKNVRKSEQVESNEVKNDPGSEQTQDKAAANSMLDACNRLMQLGVLNVCNLKREQVNELEAKVEELVTKYNHDRLQEDEEENSSQDELRATGRKREHVDVTIGGKHFASDFVETTKDGFKVPPPVVKQESSPQQNIQVNVEQISKLVETPRVTAGQNSGLVSPPNTPVNHDRLLSNPNTPADAFSDEEVNKLMKALNLKEGSKEPTKQLQPTSQTFTLAINELKEHNSDEEEDDNIF